MPPSAFRQAVAAVLLPALCSIGVRPVLADPPSVTPASVIGDLPSDYRAQIVSRILRDSSEFRSPIVTYSDPVRVHWHGADAMAVSISYTPYSADGSIFLMIASGICVFRHGALVAETSSKDPALEWIEGEPLPHEDGPGGLAYEIDHRFAQSKAMNDPARAETERRRIRKELWLKYAEAIDRLGVPDSERAQLWVLLEARKEAPIIAVANCLKEGADPFSAATGKATEAARANAQRSIDELLTPSGSAQLELLADATAQERQVRFGEGLELWADGLPLSPSQLASLGLIRAELLTLDRNPKLGAMRNHRDPNTGLSDVDSAVLDRYSRVLRPEQLAVVRQFTIDRAHAWQMHRGEAGKTSPTDPTSDPAFRSEHRYVALKKNYGAVAELHLDRDKELRLVGLLVEQELAPFEANYQSRMKGADRASGIAAMSQAQATAEANIRAFLGDELAARFEDMKVFVRDRDELETGDFATLGAEGCPLDEAQRERIEKAFFALWDPRNPNFKSLSKAPIDPVSRLRPIDVAFLDRVAPVLTERQRDVLKTYRIDLAADLTRMGLLNGGT